MQIEFQPPDGRTISGLLGSADRFEQAVRTGRNFMAAMAAHSILAVFGRFFPSAMAVACSQSDRPPQSTSAALISDPSAPDSVPDPAYVQTVGLSVEEFKEGIRAGDMAKGLAALQPTGILRGVHSPAQELERLEIECFRQSGSHRLPFLPKMAKLALWLDDPVKADCYASEALSLVLPPQVDPFDTSAAVIHDANMVVGVLALQKGDVERAKQCLLASARTKGSFELRMAGPNLTLANDLLKRGEREVVVEYLGQCQLFWMTGRDVITSKWVPEIRSGAMPDFGFLLCV